MARIMVIDDEEAVLRLISGIVEREGHEVVTAADVPTAQGLLSPPPDLIFCDIDMPGATGVEFVFELREHPTCKTVPVIFVTAYRERAAPLLASDDSCIGAIDKPFRIETLTKMLEGVLSDELAAVSPE